MAENPYQAPDSNVDATVPGQLPRHQLIPTWIKVFGWIFMVSAVLTELYFIWALVSPNDFGLNIFGVAYVGPAADPLAIALVCVIVFFGVSAYGLLFGKDWGLNACVVSGVLGISMCAAVMVYSRGTNIRLEPIMQLFFLRRLFIIRRQWNVAGMIDA